ncbi:MAG: ribulose-phosphate 3-epimerase [Candidatus Omnitrophota bacterium]
MSVPIKVAPSILSCDFANLGGEMQKCQRAGADMVHIDVMDGHFAPNLTIGPVIIKAIRPHTKILLEAHLMIESPGVFIEDYVKAGSDIITVHAECYGELLPESSGMGKFPKVVKNIGASKMQRDLQKIKSLGAKAAVALNPDTPLCIQDVLDDLDMVLIMSVNPGFAGQKFMPSILPKIKALREIFKKDIGVDGGINAETSKLVLDAGANVLVTASYFFSSGDPSGLVKSLKQYSCK